MSNIQQTIETVERLLSRKQAIPSKIVHDLLTDCKALRILCKQQREQIAALEAAAKAEEGQR